MKLLIFTISLLTSLSSFAALECSLTKTDKGQPEKTIPFTEVDISASTTNELTMKKISGNFLIEVHLNKVSRDTTIQIWDTSSNSKTTATTKALSLETINSKSTVNCADFEL